GGASGRGPGVLPAAARRGHRAGEREVRDSRTLGLTASGRRRAVDAGRATSTMLAMRSVSDARLSTQTPGSPTTDVIQIDRLVKNFGTTRALDGVDLTVRRGEVHGFLGPNGAGKSTTIRVLLGLLRADSGRATVLGGDPWHDAAELHRRLAYVPGDVNLWPNLTGCEASDPLGRLLGGRAPRRRA